ncbi:anthrone oxygenase family protein [Streptomyces cadmiisoli]|uniref:anthrone oxygenase family protein n=1 Tax=Streptomyces cadmiisoli TaxID=2184053 RepID=UPI003D71F981
MPPMLLTVTRLAATLPVGLFAGGTLFMVLAPSLMRLPASSYVPYWQALNTDYGRAMPPLLLGALALLVTTSVLSYRRGPLVFGLTVAAVLLVVAVVVLTVVQLEPLNRLADTWTAQQQPADWADVRRQWWNLHIIRTVLAMLALIVLLAAQAADREGGNGADSAHPAVPRATVVA